MNYIENEYLGLNRILLLAVGIWPYQQSKLTRFQFIFFFVILLASIIFQLTTFVTTSKYTLNLIATVLSFSSFFTIFAIKYYTFHVNIKIVKKLFIRIYYICNELKDKNEIAIIEKYGYIAKCYTVILTVFTICVFFAILIMEFWSTSDNVLLMNNITRRDMYFITEYFVDQEKNFFLIQLHMNMALGIGAIAFIGIGTMMIAFFKFMCGMFEISSYRIERAMKINIMQNITLKTKILKSEDLICAVDIHREAVTLAKHFISPFRIMYLCLIPIFVLSLCFSFVRIVSAGQTIKKAEFPIFIVVSNILYLFIANYIGQNMTDYNNYVFDTVYRIKWYVTPLHIQKIVLFLLIKGAKNFTLNLILFIPSLECFSMCVKASLSYFTVMLSI